jgi:hypothetical protein
METCECSCEPVENRDVECKWCGWQSALHRYRGVGCVGVPMREAVEAGQADGFC